MSNSSAFKPGTKVETGEAATPSYKVGVVRGVGSAELLGRDESEASVLVAWESGEEEWVEVSALREQRV